MKKKNLFEHVSGNTFKLKEAMSDPDPSKEEMMSLLQHRYGREEGFEYDAEEAIYWFASDYHGGQWSNLYSVLSTSPFKPGSMSNGPEPDSMAEMMYQDLEQEYANVQSVDNEADLPPDYPD